MNSLNNKVKRCTERLIFESICNSNGLSDDLDRNDFNIHHFESYLLELSMNIL